MLLKKIVNFEFNIDKKKLVTTKMNTNTAKTITQMK